MPDGPDFVDALAQQAIMVSYAIPGAGPGLAAVISIADGIYDWLKPQGARSDYSLAQAVADVGREVINAVQSMLDKDTYAAITGWTTASATIAAAAADYAESGTPGDALTQLDGVILDIAATEKIFSLSAPDGLSGVDKTRRDVQLLSQYMAARNNYHSLILSVMGYAAAAAGLDPQTQALQVRSVVRSYLATSLQRAIDHATPLLQALQAVDTNVTALANADPAVAPLPPGPLRTAAFTSAVRRLRHDAGYDFVTSRDITTHLSTVATLQKTADALAACPPGTIDPHVWGERLGPSGGGPGVPGGPGNGPGQPGAPGRGSSTPLRPSAPLGPRQSGTARFLYESAPNGGWVDVLSDSSVVSGWIATQNAGSSDASIYYRVAGAGVNGVFASALNQAGLLAGVNSDLAAAYDTKFGAGRFATDTATAPVPVPLTSLMVPVDQQPPVGQHVAAMVYSVGPKLSGSVTDPAGYRQIYADAFAAIAHWNASLPPIAGFRITLLSAGLYAGSSSGQDAPAQAAALDTLRLQVAGLIVEATVAALAATPALADLVILVNTNDSATMAGPERVAFDSVALARGATPSREGFDLPLH